MPSEEPSEDGIAAGDSRSWRVPWPFTAVKVAIAAAALAIPFGFGLDRISRIFGVLVAVWLLAYAVRDFLVPVRLAAGPEGVTVVAGYAGRRLIRWPEIERIRVTRQRRAEFLEIETAETLHLLSRYDLGEPPSDVIRAVEALWQAGSGGAGSGGTGSGHG